MDGEEGLIPSVAAQRWLAIASVAAVFLGPLVLARPEERFLNFYPFGIATATLVLLVSTPLLLLAVVTVRVRRSRWPKPIALLIPIAVALIGAYFGPS